MPEQHIDLVLAGLYVAAEESSQVDVLAYAGRVALLAQRARKKLRRYHTAYDALHAVSEVLFDEEGFRGNRRDYYDPRNSYLSDVLDRRLGVPISLSVIYSGVAVRCGYRLRGIGLPGHFVLRAGRAASEIYVDPFNRGGLLTRNECVQLIRKNAPDRRDPARYLRPLGNRAILRRLLTNLKLIHMRESDLPRALATAERIQLLDPRSWHNLGDLARIHTELGDFAAAADTLTAYLERAPRGENASAAREALDQLRESASEPDGSGE